MYKPVSVIKTLVKSGADIIIESDYPAIAAKELAQIIVQTEAKLTVSTKSLPASTLQEIARIAKGRVTFIC